MVHILVLPLKWRAWAYLSSSHLLCLSALMFTATADMKAKIRWSPAEDESTFNFIRSTTVFPKSFFMQQTIFSLFSHKSRKLFFFLPSFSLTGRVACVLASLQCACQSQSCHTVSAQSVLITVVFKFSFLKVNACIYTLVLTWEMQCFTHSWNKVITLCSQKPISFTNFYDFISFWSWKASDQVRYMYTVKWCWGQCTTEYWWLSEKEN